MLASLILLVATTFAAPPEVGHGKNFGIGAVVGYPPTFTGKYWFDEDGGLAFHVGAWPPVLVDSRVQYERQFVQFGDWDFGDLGMYWFAGAAARYWARVGLSDSFYLGPAGGVGGELRFKQVPAAVFVEVGTEIYVLGFDNAWGSPLGCAGGRWYF